MTSSPYPHTSRHAYVEPGRPPAGPYAATASVGVRDLGPWRSDAPPEWPPPRGAATAAVPGRETVIPPMRVPVHDHRPTPPHAQRLLTREFLAWAAARIVAATHSHAEYALQFMDQSADEPGPHALLILSADPTAGSDSEASTYAQLNCVSRLFHPDDADNLHTLLADFTTVMLARTDQARRAGQLYSALDTDTRTTYARTVLRDRRWTPGDQPFPYQQALRKGLLWDPRSPIAGLVGNTDQPVSAESTYVGVAVCTLDTDHESWADVKRRYTGRDPQTRIPFGSVNVPAQAWAWLHGGAAMHLQRGIGGIPRSYTVHTNRHLAEGIDSNRHATYVPDLLHRAPPASASGTRGTTSSQELWLHLVTLHEALADALDRRDP